jgi:hypothetical protein
MQILLKLIEKESDERIFYSSCNLLNALVNGGSTDYAEYFVKIKGIQVGRVESNDVQSDQLG